MHTTPENSELGPRDQLVAVHRCWLVATAVTIVLAVPCLWLRCFAFS